MEELEKKIEKIIKDLIYEAHMDMESIDDVLWKDKAINQLLELFKEEREKDLENGDLVSNCCAWDFNAFGVEKEEGIYQERCLKCGKLCEPLYIGKRDIENIRNLEKLELNHTEKKSNFKKSNFSCNGNACHCHHQDDYRNFSEDMFEYHCEHCYTDRKDKV